MPSPSLPKKLSTFGKNEGGSVAVIFGLIAIFIMVVAGGAVEYGQAVKSRAKLQDAVDAAVLGGARVWQVSNDLDRAKATTLTLYNENKPEIFLSSSPIITADPIQRVLAMDVNGTVPTALLRIIGINNYHIGAAGAAQTERGGSEKHAVEVSLMLDSTQGMTGPALQELKDAAKNFAEIILEDQTGWTRIALAPYAEGVRPGDDYFKKVVGMVPSQTKFQDATGMWQNYKVTPCTAERVGDQAFTAAAPIGSDRLIAIYTRDGRCTPDSNNPVTPLTYSLPTIKSAIDNLKVGGLNGGHIGVGWTWYLLSPDWNHVWPSGSIPLPYGSVRKVAVLMTSGQWEVAYDASGVATRDSGRNPNNGASDTYSRQLCDNMKLAGITVYTVGFKLTEERAIANMKYCASDPSKFFNTADGASLSLIYSDIAVQLGELKLIN